MLISIVKVAAVQGCDVVQISTSLRFSLTTWVGSPASSELFADIRSLGSVIYDYPRGLFQRAL